jgi:hypothetical protein
LRQGEFDAGAGRPSGSRRGKTRPLEIGEGAAARDIEQDAVAGIAGAGAHRGNPPAIECANAAWNIGRDARIVDIALEAEDEGASLEISAERAADQEAAGAEAGKTGRRHIAEAVAGVDADIDAAVVGT